MPSPVHPKNVRVKGEEDSEATAASTCTKKSNNNNNNNNEGRRKKDQRRRPEARGTLSYARPSKKRIQHSLGARQSPAPVWMVHVCSISVRKGANEGGPGSACGESVHRHTTGSRSYSRTIQVGTLIASMAGGGLPVGLTLKVHLHRYRTHSAVSTRAQGSSFIRGKPCVRLSVF